MKQRFEILNFSIISTGVDGGHHYLKTEIEYKSIKRGLVVLFKTKAEEEKLLVHNDKIVVSGNLIDEGEHIDLLLIDSVVA